MSIFYELNCCLERCNVIVIGKQINHYKMPLPRPTKFFRFWFAFTLCFIMWEKGRRKEFSCELHRFIPARPCRSSFCWSLSQIACRCKRVKVHEHSPQTSNRKIPSFMQTQKMYRTIWLISFLLQQMSSTDRHSFYSCLYSSNCPWQREAVNTYPPAN